MLCGNPPGIDAAEHGKRGDEVLRGREPRAVATWPRQHVCSADANQAIEALGPAQSRPLPAAGRARSRASVQALAGPRRDSGRPGARARCNRPGRAGAARAHPRGARSSLRARCVAATVPGQSPPCRDRVQAPRSARAKGRPPQRKNRLPAVRARLRRAPDDAQSAAARRTSRRSRAAALPARRAAQLGKETRRPRLHQRARKFLPDAFRRRATRVRHPRRWRA